MVVPAFGILMAGCDSENLLPDNHSRDVMLKISAPTLTSLSGETDEVPSEAALYIFSDGRLADTQTLDPSESTEISVKADDMVFCVAGAAIESVARANTPEEFMASTVVSPQGAQSAPMFYAGAGKLNDTADGMEIELTRGVARIDVACADQNVVIREIIVENAPARSTVLPAADVQGDVPVVSYTLKVGSDFNGAIEQAFTLFESAGPVNLRVKGTYDGDPMNLLTRIPVVERNKKYTLSISGGSELMSAISISDWREGATVDGTPEPGETAIDIAASSIPEGVEIDRATNKIIFPHTGVKDMKLVYVTEAPLAIERKLGDYENISVAVSEPKEKEGAYVTEFLFNVPAQPKCAAGYDATLMISGSTDFFMDLTVVASPYQIPTVMIGGHEWMCFNAISNNIDDQLFLMDGMTVEEMYNGHFAESVGNYFQYGKENPFNPWTSNDPAQFASQARDIPWQTPEHMPVPQGFHVASFAEWSDLLPNNITVPATYKCATGDSIRATIVTLPGTLQTPSANVNAKEFKMRYVLFESLSTGAKLYVPMMGIKTNSKDEIPCQSGFKFENRSGYWVKDDRYFMLFDVKVQADGSEGINIKRDRWNYDGFIGVRGIKD